MNQYYVINGWTKSSTEDSFKEGEIGKRQEFEGNERFKGGTIKAVIKSFARFCGIDDDDARLKECVCIDNMGDDPSRVEVGVMETGDGNEASETDLNEWEHGRRRLWGCNYTGYVRKITEENAVIPENWVEGGAAT